MSEQVMNQFRSDRQLREDCVAIYESLGMPENKMTRADARKVIENLRREASDTPELSMDEINAEIQAAREERKSRG